jgi:hypothetical protein
MPSHFFVFVVEQNFLCCNLSYDLEGKRNTQNTELYRREIEVKKDEERKK